MKNTKCVKAARVLFLLCIILFLIAGIGPIFNINLYVNLALYVLSMVSLAVGAILSYIAALNDKEHMKNVELSKTDERLNNITMMSKAKAFDIFSYILGLTTVVAAFTKIIDANASVILGGLCLISLILQSYYSSKFNKKM